MISLFLAMACCLLSCKKKADEALGSLQTNQTVETGVIPLPIKPAAETSALAAAAQSLAAGGNRDEAFQSVEKLREHLRSLGTNAASAEIQQWLNSGNDAPTRLDFKLSRDGSLKDAPTLRTFLLDQLAQLDPKAAAAYAEKIFEA